MTRGIALLAVLIAVTACSRDEPKLLNITQPRAEGPDEFAVLPTKPLELPDNLAALPQPTPGASNLSDPTPEADAIAALGGNAEVLARRTNDGALLSYTNRFGVDPRIRPDLAEADLAFRRANDGRILERLANTNVYFRAYESMSLDQHAETERLRRAGIRTSSPPPEEFN